jgi:hypothetical protein
MRSRWTTERTVSRGAIAAAAVAFLALIAIGGPFFETFDEAKYVGLGRSLYGGLGYTTVFGGAFLTHPPGWPLLLVGPEAAFGLDPFVWGRILNAVGGVALVLLAGWIGWRVRPAVGGLAAAALVSVPYVADLSRTARLDIPGAAVSVLAAVVGVVAVERASTRRAIAAGILFTVAFLIKETSLVLIAVPTLAGVIEGRRLASIARVTAWIALVVAIGAGWWFAFVAASTGLVYRTSLPAWTLVPAGVALAALIAAGLGAERLGERWRHGFAAIPDRRLVWLGIAGSVAWAGALLVVLARSPELGGTGLLDRVQLGTWFDSWGRTIRSAALFIGFGSIALVAAMAVDWWDRRRAQGRDDEAGGEPAPLRPAPILPRHAAALLVPAIAASVPLVLFVIATGEPPRNDFAPLVFAVALAAAGWIAALDRLRLATRLVPAVVAGAAVGAAAGLVVAAINGIPSFRVAAVGGAVTGVVLGALPWLGWRIPAGASKTDDLIRGTLRHAVVLAVLIAVVGSVGALAIHVRRTPGTAATSPRGVAIRAITTWIREHEPPGTALAMGSLLSNEVSIQLAGYRVSKLSAIQAGIVGGAPLGLAVRPGETFDDWISVDPHPRKTDQFLGFRAGLIEDASKSAGIERWIYVTGESTAAPSVVESLTPEHGFTVLEHWSWPNGRRALEAWVFAIDPAVLGFAGAPLVIAPPALDRLVRLLEAQPDGAAVAGRLVERIRVEPAGADADAAVSALRALTARP